MNNFAEDFGGWGVAKIAFIYAQVQIEKITVVSLLILVAAFLVFRFWPPRESNHAELIKWSWASLGTSACLGFISTGWLTYPLMNEASMTTTSDLKSYFQAIIAFQPFTLIVGFILLLVYIARETRFKASNPS